MRELDIAVLPGDGIGQEIMPPCLELLTEAAKRSGGFRLNYQHLEAGAALYQRTGDAFPEETFSAATGADAILFGAMGLPDVRYADGREIAPQLDLRERLNLYAGLRPAKTMPGLPPVLADPRAEQLDLVIVRESTEGLFSARTSSERDGDQAARDTLLITRPVCEKLFDFSFRLARKRQERGKPGSVTCVDKANVLGSFAFFREIFTERSHLFPEIEANYCYVDAMALNLVKQPWNYDVLVTENMFGDILSDQAAALVGGMGMAPSADIGDKQAVFQPCHGSAPDIAGSGKANPTAMFLSAALMLDWLGEQYNVPEACRAADVLNYAIEAAFAGGDLLPYEFGGKSGLREIFDAVSAKLSVKKVAE
jgi:3-isopropylmalate dehydrogenase